MPFAFIEGFDDYPISAGEPGIGIDSVWPGENANGLVPGRFGYQALNKGNSYVSHRNFTPTHQIVFGCAFRIGSFANSLMGRVFILTGNTSDYNNKILDVRCDLSGQLYVYGIGRDEVPLPRQAVGNTWHYMEIIADNTTPGSADLKIYLDGELVLDGEFPMSGTSFAMIWVAGMRLSSTSFDDMYLVTDSVTRIGEARAQLLLATADESADWTPSEGSSNYAMIDEQQADTTTYNSTNTVGDKDLFTMGDLPGIPEEVYAVQITLAARKSDSATRVLTPKIKVGGVEYDGPDQYLAANFTWRHWITTQAPDGGEWTPEKVNAISAGYQLKE